MNMYIIQVYTYIIVGANLSTGNCYKPKILNGNKR